MAFNQTREVLNHARQFHRRLSAFYAELRDETDKERARTLLDYMSRHEQCLAESLTAYEEGVKNGVLDTYFKYESEASPLSKITEFRIKPDMDVDDVFAAAMHFDACLIAFYREMAQRAISSKVREVFENLLLLEQQEQIGLSKQAVGLESL